MRSHEGAQKISDIDKHLHLPACPVALAVAAGDFSSAANSRIHRQLMSNTTFVSTPPSGSTTPWRPPVPYPLAPFASACLPACLVCPALALPK